MSFASWLQDSKTAFLKEYNQPGPINDWLVVVGNEAGDLDTVASSIAYAYLATTSTRLRYAPLLLTAPADFGLRPENELALSAASIPPAALLTTADLETASLGPRGVRFVLVDHNALLSVFRPEGSAANERTDGWVAAIVDHHQDEGQHRGADPRTLETVGSASSLVTRQFCRTRGRPVPREVADLLLAALMIDTSLKPAGQKGGGKATPVDLEALETLLPFSSFGGGTTVAAKTTGRLGEDPSVQEALATQMEKLQSTKFNVSHLSTFDLLRRDYKEYTEGPWRYGLSTVPLSLDALLAKPPSTSLTSTGSASPTETGWAALAHSLDGWMQDRHLRFAGVLNSYTSAPGPKGAKHARELVLVARTPPSADEPVGALDPVFGALAADDVLRLGPWKGTSDRTAAPLGLGDVPGRDGMRWQVWQQENVKATRKQVQPALVAVLRKVLAGSGKL